MKHMYQYQFRFYLDAQNEQFFRRQCIVPLDWKLGTVKHYLEQSLGVPMKECICLGRMDVYLLQSEIRQDSSSKTAGIEAYWSDVKEYSVALSEAQHSESIYVLTDYSTDEQLVKERLQPLFPSKQIRVDYDADCWLLKERDCDGSV